jgi:Mce-associated membrane protein
MLYRRSDYPKWITSFSLCTVLSGQEVFMPGRKRSTPVLDADTVDEMPEDPDRASADALALAEEAEAEAAEAEALAAAARARARAIRLRRQAGAAEAEEPETVVAEEPEVVADAPDVDELEADESEAVADAPEAAEPDEDSTVDKAVATDEPADKPLRRRRLRLRRPKWKAVVASLAIICTLALLAASGYLIWYHKQAQHEQQRKAEFAAAARQGVVTLMSLDFKTAKDDVQRIIDSSTGQFKTDFESTAADFTKVAQDSKVVTEANVSATAVDTMTNDTAVVLVSATSRVTNDRGARQEPRTWRLSVSVARDGGQIKMSKVEFVP